MTLKVVDPINVTDAVLTASDIPEPDTARGEIEWDESRFLGESVPEVSNGEGLLFDGTNYSIIGWDNQSLIATIYMYNSSFSFLSSKSISSGQPYVSGDKRDICHDGSGYWFSNGDQISKYDSSWDYDGLVINIETEFSNAYVQTICSDGTFIYAVIKDFTDAMYKIAKYNVSDGLFVEQKTIQQNLEVKIKGSTFRDGAIKHFARRDYDGELLKVYSTDLSLNGFLDIGTVQSVNPSLDLGLDGVDTGYITLNADSKLVNSYNSGYILFGSYKPEDRVILTSEHLIYQCLKETIQNPKDGATEDAAATWIVVGPTNKWAMFDGLKENATVNPTDFTVTLNPVTYVNTLAMLGFSGVSEIRIEVDNSSGSTIYNKTFGMSDFSAIYDHYTYVFYQIVSIKKFIVEDLPPLPNTTIRVTFSGVDMSIGEVVQGFAINVGQLVAESTKSDRFRYREQQYNEFGYPTGAPPITVELNTYDVLVGKLNNPAIQKLLDTVTGENTLWLGDIGGGQSLVTYGFFERSPIPYSMPNHINYQITVRASV